MKCYKRIIPLILACMMLAGCGQNIYKKGVESLENKDYEAAQENFRKAVEVRKMWPIPIVDWELHIMNRKNTKMRLLHLKSSFSRNEGDRNNL